MVAKVIGSATTWGRPEAGQHPFVRRSGYLYAAFHQGRHGGVDLITTQPQGLRFSGGPVVTVAVIRESYHVITQELLHIRSIPEISKRHDISGLYVTGMALFKHCESRPGMSQCLHLKCGRGARAAGAPVGHLTL
jgi:hypothetical protein